MTQGTPATRYTRTDPRHQGEGACRRAQGTITRHTARAGARRAAGPRLCRRVARAIGSGRAGCNCRNQESESQPRRVAPDLRSGRDRDSLRGRGRDLRFGADRPRVFPGRSGRSGCGASGVLAAGAAQRFRARRIPDRRITGARCRLHPTNRCGDRRRPTRHARDCRRASSGWRCWRKSTTPSSSTERCGW